MDYAGHLLMTGDISASASWLLREGWAGLLHSVSKITMPFQMQCLFSI